MNTTSNYGFAETVISYSNIDQQLRRVEDKVDLNTAALANKVEKVNGYGLIPEGKVEQIIQNTSRLDSLSDRTSNLDTAVADRYTKAEMDDKLGNKADKCALEKHMIDPNAHSELFASKVDKSELYDQLNSIRELLADKVDKIPGYNLLSDEEKAQIQQDLVDVRDGIAGMYTKTEVDNLLAEKVDKGSPVRRPITEILNSDFTSGGYYFKDAFGKVHVRYALTKNQDKDIVGGDILFNLPVGYRPDMPLNIVVDVLNSEGGPQGFGLITVRPDGAVLIIGTTENDQPPVNGNRIYGMIEFYADDITS